MYPWIDFFLTFICTFINHLFISACTLLFRSWSNITLLLLQCSTCGQHELFHLASVYLWNPASVWALFSSEYFLAFARQGAQESFCIFAGPGPKNNHFSSKPSSFYWRMVWEKKIWILCMFTFSEMSLFLVALVWRQEMYVCMCTAYSHKLINISLHYSLSTFS